MKTLSGILILSFLLATGACKKDAKTKEIHTTDTVKTSVTISKYCQQSKTTGFDKDGLKNSETTWFRKTNGNLDSVVSIAYPAGTRSVTYAEYLNPLKRKMSTPAIPNYYWVEFLDPDTKATVRSETYSNGALIGSSTVQFSCN